MDDLSSAFLSLGTGLRWLGYGISPIVLVPIFILALPGLTANFAKQIYRFLDAVSGWALGVAMGAATIMVVAQLCVVIVRYVFGLAFSWLDETVIYAFAGMFLLGAAAALRDDAHVRVDILRPLFSHRNRAGIELAGFYLFILPIGLLTLWAVAPSLARSWANFEGSRESDGLPLFFLFRTLIPGFAVLLILQGLSQAIKAALVVRGVDTPKSEDQSSTSAGAL
ncbi:MAG: TRAP transporter small permease subunit [Pseudomonadota bacterium]